MDAIPSKVDASPLPFLHLMGVLKHLPRTGWLRTIQAPESVASHTFRLAALAMCAPSPLDRAKCVFLALCHDMAEATAGDIPTYAGVSKEEKRKLEDLGTRFIESLLKPYDAGLGRAIRAAWLEYEDGTSPEAKYIREMDKFECMIQAHEYEQKTFGEKNLEEFQGQSSKILSEQGKSWLELLQQERQAHLSKRRKRIPVIFVIGALEKKHSLLDDEFDFQHISLDDVLNEKADDREYLHAEVVKDYLEAKVNVPKELAVSLLEEKINDGLVKGNKWILVYGFPDSMESLLEFEEKVQKPNYTLFSCSPETKPRSESLSVLGEERDAAITIQEAQTAQVALHLRSTEGFYKQVDTDGPVERVTGSFRSAITEFAKHSQAQ